MRSRLALLALGLLLPLGGCGWFNRNILHHGNDGKPTASNERPTKEKLVAYLNGRSAQLNSLQVNSLSIDASMGAGVFRSVVLNGTLQAQKPRNFRMEGYVPGAKTDVVDLGSNDHEFWFWVGEFGRGNGDQYLYHCSHTDLPKAQLPLPIHPDWIMEALGMGTIAPGADVQMKYAKDGKTIELIEATRGPQGQPMQKVTVFNARTVSGTEPQVTARKLVDDRGKLICTAEITEMQQDPQTGLVVPREIRLFYPADRKFDQISLRLRLDTIAVNKPIDPALAGVWFTRPQKPGVVALDIGRQNGNRSFRSPPENSPGGGIFRGRSR